MEIYNRININEICKKVCSGGTPKSIHTEYYGGNIPWLNTKEVNFNRIYKTEKNITDSGLENSSAKWIEPNAVIVAMYGATAGKTAITKIPLTTNQACCNLMMDENKADYRFVYYALCDDYIRLASMANGGAQQNLNAQQIKDFDIPYPSLPTQQKIANILSSLDDKIEVNRRINEQLEELAGALFKSWFVDFEPFKDGEFVDSELGMIPKGWKVGTLGELCITNKRTYGAKFADEIAYLDTGSVTKNQIEGFQILNPEVDKIPSRARRAVTEGDILFSSVRPNQKHYAFLFAPQTNMVASTGFIVITANWSGYRYFIYQYLIQEEIIDKLQAIAEQSVSTYPSINASDITNLKLVIPPMDIIGKFAGMNLAFMSEIDKNQQEIHHLTTLRDTLLPKLMSGEIDVNLFNV